VPPDGDWGAGVDFLDQELRQIVPEAELGKQQVDKLIQVTRREPAGSGKGAPHEPAGETQWVLLHIEVQAQPDPNLPERLFQYHCRILERFGKRTATLAVLADGRHRWRPRVYEADLWDCRVRFEFPIVKLLDFTPGVLEASPNPVAIVIAAHLAAVRTRGNMEARKRFKWLLTRRLYDRGWDNNEIVKLYRLISWLMVLPNELEAQFREDLIRFEKENDMPRLAPFEQMAREEGIEQGIKQGIEQGRRESAASLLLRQARKRFPALSPDDAAAIGALDLPALESFSDALLDFDSVEALGRWIRERDG